jgi:hypothetical protein
MFESQNCLRAGGKGMHNILKQNYKKSLRDIKHKFRSKVKQI